MSRRSKFDYIYINNTKSNSTITIYLDDNKFLPSDKTKLKVSIKDDYIEFKRACEFDEGKYIKFTFKCKNDKYSHKITIPLQIIQGRYLLEKEDEDTYICDLNKVYD